MKRGKSFRGLPRGSTGKKKSDERVSRAETPAKYRKEGLKKEKLNKKKKKKKKKEKKKNKKKKKKETTKKGRQMVHKRKDSPGKKRSGWRQ